jgi:predicted RNase H-like HicB family nuclease
LRSTVQKRRQAGTHSKRFARFDGVAAACSRVASAVKLWHKISMRKSSKRQFNVILERDEEGYYVASVAELAGCHTQARSLDKLIERIREAIELCQEVERDVRPTTEFIGVQRITV